MFYRPQFTFQDINDMGHLYKQVKYLIEPPSLLEVDMLGLINIMGDCLKVTPEQLKEAKQQHEAIIAERCRKGQAMYEAMGWDKIKKLKKVK